MSVKKVFLIIMISLGFCSGLARTILFDRLIKSSPDKPDSISGQLYALNNHGSVRFITSAQQTTLRFLFLCFIACFFGGVILDRRWNVFYDHKHPKYHDQTMPLPHQYLRIAIGIAASLLILSAFYHHYARHIG